MNLLKRSSLIAAQVWLCGVVLFFHGSVIFGVPVKDRQTPSARLMATLGSAAETATPNSHVAVAAAAPAAVAKSEASIEQRAFALINERRRASSLAPLVWDGELGRMARLHSQHMARQRFFAHVGPDGLDISERLSEKVRQPVSVT